jgi:hypothetical protein
MMIQFELANTYGILIYLAHVELAVQICNSCQLSVTWVPQGEGNGSAIRSLSPSQFPWQ